jgi:putative transposase
MPRLPRIVLPGCAHHVTQRGVRRQKVFFADADYRLYLALLARRATPAGVEVLAYCLMPNHVHLLVVPATAEALARLFRSLHSHYAELVNAREGWTGHLWQQRFQSFPMDARHLRAALFYVLLNPVRAGLVEEATSWAWSSARAHAGFGRDPVLGSRALPFSPRHDDGLLATALTSLRAASRLSRPLGSASFLEEIELRLGRTLPRPWREDASASPGPSFDPGGRPEGPRFSSPAPEPSPT